MPRWADRPAEYCRSIGALVPEPAEPAGSSSPDHPQDVAVTAGSDRPITAAGHGLAPRAMQRARHDRAGGSAARHRPFQIQDPSPSAADGPDQLGPDWLPPAVQPWQRHRPDSRRPAPPLRAPLMVHGTPARHLNFQGAVGTQQRPLRAPRATPALAAAPQRHRHRHQQPPTGLPAIEPAPPL